jgi:hypothetical protein
MLDAKHKSIVTEIARQSTLAIFYAEKANI